MTNKYDLNFKNVDKIFEKIQKEKVDDLAMRKFGEENNKKMSLKKTHRFLGKLISKLRK